jgi:hypothetical protein
MELSIFVDVAGTLFTVHNQNNNPCMYQQTRLKIYDTLNPYSEESKKQLHKYTEAYGK